ncbi:MAG: peptidoglycan-binding domain-containing protein [Candidatus Omnitrophota bacterium]|jgi:peptidoglycan hydrolase-like protein with peptidoglycan-binding domain
MKGFIVGVSCVAMICLGGCSKKQQALEEMQQPMSPEDLSMLATESQKQTSSDTSKSVVTAVAPASQTMVAPTTATPAEAGLGAMPPAGPYKPANIEIQTALKNAGFYLGIVDGKLGPMTRKAIEEFQKSKGLVVDGKIGPKTWGLLSVYLNPAPSAAKTNKKKSR